MRPGIATVVGAGWEPRLVEHARTSGLARLVGRCCDPEGLADVARRADVVFIGSEVPWLAGSELGHLRAATRLIGVATDAPGALLLDRAGVVDVIDASTPPSGMLSVALSSLARRPGRLVEVTGPRGAPGRSEVALALAYASEDAGGVRLIELDPDAPSLGLRMALAPVPTRTVHALDRVGLDPSPVGTTAHRPSDTLRRIEDSRAVSGLVILDSGPHAVWHRMTDVDDVVLVGEATDVGVVRLARMCEAWLGPTPRLVINRHRPDQDLRRVRRATGLEPDAVIPELPMPPAGHRPPTQMVGALGGLLVQRTAL